MSIEQLLKSNASTSKIISFLSNHHNSKIDLGLIATWLKTDKYSLKKRLIAKYKLNKDFTIKSTVSAKTGIVSKTSKTYFVTPKCCKSLITKTYNATKQSFNDGSHIDWFIWEPVNTAHIVHLSNNNKAFPITKDNLYMNALTTLPIQKTLTMPL